MTEIEELLNDLKMSEQQLENMTRAGPVLEFDIKSIEMGPSKIHGVGIIATEDIKKDSVIGLASINRDYKTVLGRYTNHSPTPNCSFELLLNEDFVMVSLEDITIGQELLVNYKEHLLSPDYYLGGEDV